MSIGEQYRAIVALVREGRIVTAVARAQKEWGLGLREAKELVEAIVETHYPPKAK